jgi:hypothetical protein
MSNEQMRWVLKVIQPEQTLAGLPGGAGISRETHAALLGLPSETLCGGARPHEGRGRGKRRASCLADPAVASMIDRLPLQKGATVVAFRRQPHVRSPVVGRHPEGVAQCARRPADEITVTIRAVGRRDHDAWARPHGPCRRPAAGLDPVSHRDQRCADPRSPRDQDARPSLRRRRATSRSWVNG